MVAILPRLTYFYFPKLREEPNKIIHHRDMSEVKISLKKGQKCRDTVQETINYLNKTLFGRK